MVWQLYDILIFENTIIILSIENGLSKQYDIICIYARKSVYVMGRSRGATGGRDPPPPLKIHKNMGFLSKTGPDPVKNHKATKPAAMLGHHWPARETPFKWCFAGGQMIAHLYLYSLIKKKSYLIWTPSDKTFWIHACSVNCPWALPANPKTDFLAIHGSRKFSKGGPDNFILFFLVINLFHRGM